LRTQKEVTKSYRKVEANGLSAGQASYSICTLNSSICEGKKEGRERRNKGKKEKIKRGEIKT